MLSAATLAFCLPNVSRAEIYRCQSAIERILLNPKHDSSAEMELSGYPDTVLALLEPIDGTVGGLFKGFDMDPVRSHLGNRSEQELKAISWDSLSIDLQRKLLAQVANQKKTSFFSDRKLPNLKVRDSAVLPFDRLNSASELKPPFGKEDIIQSEPFPIGKYLRNPEFIGPDHSPFNTELHLRARLSAGDVLKSAWALEKILGMDRTHMHVHIVADIPRAELAADPEGQAGIMADYFRRANLALELESMVRGVEVGTRKKGGVTYFDNLSDSQLKGVYDHLSGGARFPIGSQFKMGWVGFRGFDTYDVPDIFGFEVRAISSSDPLPRIREYLNTIQWGLENREYGYSTDHLKRWKANVSPGLRMGEAIRKTWYDRSFSELYADAAPEIQTLILDPQRKKMIESEMRIDWGMEPAHADEIKLLLHPWHQDPLFDGFPQIQQTVRQAQSRYLNEYLNGHLRRSAAVQGFIKDSKLKLAVEKSLSSPPTEVIKEVYALP